MLNLLLGALLFLPQTVVKNHPLPDPKCLYQWISDDSKLENVCDSPLVVDVAYKNGRGVHTVLKKGDVINLLKPPMKIFACTEGQGVPSAAPDHMVHPGFRSGAYTCLTQQLEFAMPAGGPECVNDFTHMKEPCAKALIGR